MKDFFHNMFSTLIIACLFVYFGGVLINQEKEMRIIDEKMKVQNELLAEAKMKTLEINEEIKKMGTEEYAEEYGIKKGWLGEGQIKFVIENYN